MLLVATASYLRRDVLNSFHVRVQVQRDALAQSLSRILEDYAVKIILNPDLVQALAEHVLRKETSLAQGLPSTITYERVTL